MSGHRFNYVRILVEFAMRHGIPIVLLTTSAGHEEYLAKVTGEARGVAVITFSSEMASLTEVMRISRRIRASDVIFPTGDWAALRLLLTGGWHGAGRLRILVIREFGQAQGGLTVWLKTFVRKAIFAIVTAQTRVTVGLLTSPISPTKGFLVRIPDPIEFEPSPELIAELRAAYGISSTVYWFAIVGALDERKNIPLVTEALYLAARRTARPLGLILAGPQSDKARARFADCRADSPPYFIEADHQLTSTELDSFIAIADCLVSAHSNDSPSGILGKAVAGGRAVLAAGSPTLLRDVERLGVGAHWCRLEPEEIAEKMLVAVKDNSSTSANLAGADEFTRFLFDLHDQ